MQNKIAIIPARGGSKRLPRKNILTIEGHPMLYYPIQTALKSGLFDEVIVSTEDREIKEIARRSGATVFNRPKELAQDSSTVVEVCLHVLGVIEKDYGNLDEFCCIYATAIFVTVEDLIDSYRLLQENPDVDYIMGVSEYDLHPFLALRDLDGYLVSMWPELMKKEHQPFPTLLASNGTLYWAKVDAFRSERTFYGKRLKGYKMPRDRAIDIDTQEDLNIARVLAGSRDSKIR